MKKFDLSKISDAVLISMLDHYCEKDKLTQYILSLNKIDIYKFIFGSVDLYNTLEDDSQLKKNISIFLVQKELTLFRNKIMLWLNEDFLTRKDFLEIQIASERLSLDSGSGLVDLVDLEKLESEYYIQRNRKVKLQAILNKNI